VTETGVQWRHATLHDDASLEKVIENLNFTGLRVVLCVDKDDRFLGTATDGDVRRGLLRGLSMQANIMEIIELNP